jgi:hypothetical protein
VGEDIPEGLPAGSVYPCCSRALFGRASRDIRPTAQPSVHKVVLLPEGGIPSVGVLGAGRGQNVLVRGWRGLRDKGGE